jgi:hypothetical protein
MEDLLQLRALLEAQGLTHSAEVAELRGEVVTLREELAAGVAKRDLMLEQLLEISTAALAKLAGESFIEPLRMVRAAREEEAAARRKSQDAEAEHSLQRARAAEELEARRRGVARRAAEEAERAAEQARLTEIARVDSQRIADIRAAAEAKRAAKRKHLLSGLVADDDDDGGDASARGGLFGGAPLPKPSPAKALATAAAAAATGTSSSSSRSGTFSLFEGERPSSLFDS